eukprot:CAMPEP_0206516346 /NCGR_PEP_ID=MMETSP0324_2-20121206/63327_1 /ASSEMBLY_ACC=CAM_ASM_000836 /TAXON_ID=2866 /ORGANISM="Crypthecodinium cohnii, Strain Seligo" /LENGTH=435 /DNA_ID=CAMNT_0054009291 /DNA_START=241 /DNA_END=1548 /DNA_ORIENTATION=-
MVLMVLQGLFFTVQLVCGKLLQQANWPFFRLFAVSALLSSAVMSLRLILLKQPRPKWRAWVWVLLRGFFGMLNFIFLASAVRVGASAGDVASLASVNTVVAALLGFLFLGEPLHVLHWIALSLCMGGAVCIAQPDFLFRSSSSDNSGGQWKGYLLAVLGGTAQAGIAIASRKSGEVSLEAMNVITLLMLALANGLLPQTPLLEDATLTPALEAPWTALGWMAILALAALTAISTASAGSAWCPAAVSTTAGTAARMVWGYLAEVFIFAGPIKPLTFLGAGLMMFGIVLMALSRGSPPKLPGIDKQAGASTAALAEAIVDGITEPSFPSEASSSFARLGVDGGDDADAAAAAAAAADAAAAAAAAGVAGDWDDESIASYIAAEFALRSPHCSSSVELSGLHTGIETTVRRRGAVAAAAAVEVAANAVVPELLGASA